MMHLLRVSNSFQYWIPEPAYTETGALQIFFPSLFEKQNSPNAPQTSLIFNICPVPIVILLRAVSQTPYITCRAVGQLAEIREGWEDLLRHTTGCPSLLSFYCKVTRVNVSGTFHCNERSSNAPEVTRNMESNPNQRWIIKDSHSLFITKYKHAAFKTNFPVSLAGNQSFHSGLPEQRSTCIPPVKMA